MNTLCFFQRLILTGVFGLLSCASARAADAPKRLNILFILTDDQRFDTVHAMGNAIIQTPNMDKLVARGFSFTNVFSQGGMVPAMCLPSRTMIMTGRSIFHIPGANPKNFTDPTIAGVFNDAGYSSIYIGKKGNSFIPGNEAFSKFFYLQHGSEAPGQDENSLQAQHPKVMADQAIEFLRAQKEKPFFVFLAPHYPHDPRVAPKRFHEMYDPAKMPLPENFLPEHPFDNGALNVRDENLAPHPRTPDVMKQHLVDYYTCISYLDEQIGRVIDTLKEIGHADDTIIVFTSDQGLSVGGMHGLMGKQNLYEEFKSPLTIVGPGIAHGKSGALVYLFDLFPTLCDLTGVAKPKVCEGASLVPVMKGEGSRVRELLFAPYIETQRMVRDERWKLIWYPKVARFQLFDLASDPWEQRDLNDKPEQSAKLAEMKKKLAAEQDRWDDTATRPQ